MKRHELWNDRAEKLMEKTFEKFGYGKKKEPAKEEKKEEIKENLQEAPRYGEDYADMDGEDDGGNSLLDYEDYNMLVQAVEEPVRKLIAGGHTKEDLLDAFKVMLGFENVNEDKGMPSQADQDAAFSKIKYRPGEHGPQKDLRFKEPAIRVEKLKDAISAGKIDLENLLSELELISSMLQNSDGINEEEYEDPEVQRAAEDAKKAKIKAVKAQLAALQKND